MPVIITSLVDCCATVMSSMKPNEAALLPLFRSGEDVDGVTEAKKLRRIVEPFLSVTVTVTIASPLAPPLGLYSTDPVVSPFRTTRKLIKLLLSIQRQVNV